jgi:ubiquinone/menaquinone biosynthesis C-methylase UbiE
VVAAAGRVCPVELAGSLDSRLRRWLHDPRSILAPLVREGETALDVGCGPGFFTVELARLVGPAGHVVAADLQEGMLRKLSAKLQVAGLASRVTLARCDEARINVSVAVDVILAFWMVHEVPDKAAFFAQLKGVLRRGGRLLLAEPKLFHVSRREFAATVRTAERAGFVAEPGPKVRLSWTAVLRHA